MRQYTYREFDSICRANGFHLKRYSGDHALYYNSTGNHISVPLKLESVIARRLIKENNLETNIKKMKKGMSGYPAGAADDVRAPYNEPLTKDYTRFVSTSISYVDTIRLPIGSSENEIEKAFTQKVKDGDFPKEFEVDEIVILDE